jgi:hypothetical protein
VHLAEHLRRRVGARLRRPRAAQAAQRAEVGELDHTADAHLGTTGVGAQRQLVLRPSRALSQSVAITVKLSQ